VKSLARVIVAFTNLAEAEGRNLRQEAVKTGLALGFVILAVVLALGGLGFLAAALYIALADVMHPAWAAFISGWIVIAVAGVLAWIAIGIVKIRFTREAPHPEEPESTAGMTPAGAH
jgi:hypothetical protein